ncbi:hypothetical protein D9615_006970 [Tricholomella constricta]|uniref:Tail specific protease domain-containing protein n=1 Tax=Tricholomella constricta TaxID=117010 RepID=A0A8H5M2C9_9AGAR|nr:hypothetical protein D9615_006970 [Tricholomella constricta]
MVSTPKFLAAFVGLSLVGAAVLEERAPDPCAAIAGKKWVAPRDVRACYSSIKVDEMIKSNITEVINKTLAFHASTNYQIKAPQPFADDVHEDVLATLAKIKQKRYRSDYDLHIDLSRALKRLNDGHCVWINRCYLRLSQAAFTNFLPTPMSLLTAPDGTQSVHISPEAFTVAKAEFPDQIQFWQDSLLGPLKGKLESLSGAKVLLINGRPPFNAVNDNAQITGSYQSFATRQNSFFSSYQAAAAGWTYLMGNFAQQSLPLSDIAILTIQRINHTLPEIVILPYRSRIGSSVKPFTDVKSYLANNCVAVAGTNGEDIYSSSFASIIPAERPVEKFQQQAPVSAQIARKHLIDVTLDTSPLSDVVLPPVLVPGLPAAPGSRNAAQFYLLNDGKTGVLALGSFSDSDYFPFLDSLLKGLVSLKSQGATQLVIDVTNNGGGFICAAHWLHRIIIGPKSTTLIVKQIVNNNADPDNQLLYNPLQWNDANNQQFAANEDWLQPPVEKIINGRRDAFSQRLGQECQPAGFPSNVPEVALFDPKKVVIVSNGRCASSCSLFSITMSKHEGVKTVVVGGKKDTQQQYCGIVGGQSTDFSTIDTEIKTTHLKNNTLAPPDLCVFLPFAVLFRLQLPILAILVLSSHLAVTPAKSGPPFDFASSCVIE